MPNASDFEDLREPISRSSVRRVCARILGSAALDPHLVGGRHAAITICVETG